MTLPPLANLFAVRDRDSHLMARLERELSAAPEFERVWRPAPGWIAALAPLPGSDAEPETVFSGGFAFWTWLRLAKPVWWLALHGGTRSRRTGWRGELA